MTFRGLSYTDVTIRDNLLLKVKQTQYILLSVVTDLCYFAPLHCYLLYNFYIVPSSSMRVIKL